MEPIEQFDEELHQLVHEYEGDVSPAALADRLSLQLEFIESVLQS